MRVGQSFYEGSTLDVAKRLLGQRLVRHAPWGILAGWIVEVEAYLPKGDAACHASRGRTQRNEVMFAQAGTLYVYSIHNHHCMNIVTEDEGVGAAVLIRALEPIYGLESMRKNRPQVSDRDLTNGPGKVCQAFGIAKTLNGLNLLDSDQLWVESEPGLNRSKNWSLGRSPRIGISQATDKLWRFFIDGNFYVSGRASDHRRPRISTLASFFS